MVASFHTESDVTSAAIINHLLPFKTKRLGIILSAVAIFFLFLKRNHNHNWYQWVKTLQKTGIS